MTTPKVYFDEAAYVRESRKVALSIIGFIVFYLFLLAFTVGVAIVAAVAGISMIVAYPHFITLGIGIGLVLFGLFIIYFMVKFVFTTTDTTDNTRVEITAEQEPQLMALINELAAKAGTQAPRRVYLSHRVNACVFYDSFSFWSLFLPIRKNLELGLGLFSSLNVSELSSIIAHEFGHFSQKSMKFGSYIYHANRVIYNMLYENEEWANNVNSIGQTHWTLSIFAGMSIYYARFIIWTMQGLYEFINVRYMSLSRQMEFHADKVAVEICGTEAFKSAMTKIEWTDAAMEEALNNLNSLVKANLKSRNIFACQSRVLKHLAIINGEKFNDGMLLLTDNRKKQSNYRPRVKIENQWASHPLTSERLENAEALASVQPVNGNICWTLLASAEKTQEQITAHVYTISNLKADKELSTAEFEQEYLRKAELYKASELYGGYFNNRVVEKIDLTTPLPENTTRNPFELLYPLNSIPPSSYITGITNDIALLKEIENENVKIKYFDFDGTKYEAYQAIIYRKQLEEELEKYQLQLKANDKWLYDYACYTSLVNAEELKALYERMYDLGKAADKFTEAFHTAWASVEAVYSNKDLSFVKSKISYFRNVDLPEVVKFWNGLSAENGLLKTYPDAAFEESMKSFMALRYEYFDGTTLYNDQFNHLAAMATETLNYIQSCALVENRKILALQVEMAKVSEAAIPA